MKHKKAVKIIARMGKRFRRIVRLVENARSCGHSVHLDTAMGTDGPAWVQITLTCKNWTRQRSIHEEFIPTIASRTYKFDVSPQGRVKLPELFDTHYLTRPEWANELMRDFARQTHRPN